MHWTLWHTQHNVHCQLTFPRFENLIFSSADGEGKIFQVRIHSQLGLWPLVSTTRLIHFVLKATSLVFCFVLFLRESSATETLCVLVIRQHNHTAASHMGQSLKASIAVLAL